MSRFVARFKTLSVVLALLLPVSALGADGNPIRSEKHAFNVNVLVQGLQNPWSIAWLPDGRMLVTERTGRLRIVSKDFKLDPKAIEGLPRIVGGGQGGVFEVAAHPHYKDNGWIYLSYGGAGDGGHGTELIRAKLDRHRLSEQQVLFRLEPKSGGSQHFGGRIVFDGK